MSRLNEYQREEFARHGDRDDLMSMQGRGEEPINIIRVPANTYGDCKKEILENMARRKAAHDKKVYDSIPKCRAFSHCCNARIVRIDAVRMEQGYAQHKCPKCEKLLTTYTW